MSAPSAYCAFCGKQRAVNGNGVFRLHEGAAPPQACEGSWRTPAPAPPPVDRQGAAPGDPVRWTRRRERMRKLLNLDAPDEVVFNEAKLMCEAWNPALRRLLSPEDEVTGPTPVPLEIPDEEEWP